MLKQKGLSKRQEKILSHINDLDWQAATDVIQAGLQYGAIATIKRDLKILFVLGIHRTLRTGACHKVSKVILCRLSF